MYMKGLSAVIAAIILLLISIALASFAFTFFARMPVKVSSAAEEEARQFVGDLTPFRIDTIDNGNLYIRNLDIKPIEGEHLALFVDNTLVNTSSNNLTPGGVTLVNISDGILASGSYDFKITTRLIEKSETLTVPKNNVAKDPSFGEGRFPVDVVLIIDISGSMNYSCTPPCRIDSAKSAATAFVDMTNQNDRVGLVSFNDTATLNQPLTLSKTAVKSSISMLTVEPTGGTKIGHGIGNATKEFADNPRVAEKIEVLLTDGIDNPYYPSRPIEEATNAAAQDITIYTIGFGTGMTINETLLRRIANITGGKYYNTTVGSELITIFADIGEQLSINWIKTGNITVDVFGPACSSPNVCAKFSGDISGSALYQNIKLVFPGSYNAEASVNALTNGSVCSSCPSLPGETCAKNDARIRLLAFDEANSVIGNVTSPWASASGLGGMNRIAKTWTTPPDTKTIRFQIEPGDCCSCSVDSVYVDDADMKISKP